MQLIALLPGLWAAVVAFTKSPHRAFLAVYIPVLLCLPDYYRWIAPGLPDPSFSHVAVLSVMLALAARGMKGWRFSLADVFVMGFASCVGYSEYSNTGYKEAQNLMFDMVCLVVLPYVLTKSLVEPQGLRVQFAKRVVDCMFFVSVVSVFEFKFGTTPWRLLLDRFFPGQAEGWVTTFRWGFARVAGPYGHAILAGAILVSGFRIHRWLDWSGLWEPRFHRVALPWPKAKVITYSMIAGIVMTMVRGPWIGAILALGVTTIGRSKRRWQAVGAVLAVAVVVGVPAGVAMLQYASVGRANAKTVAQESACYRKELIDKYLDVALEHSSWGWGRNTWPRVSGMPSIDNYYLLLAIMHGVPALGFLLCILLVMPLRLFFFEMKEPSPEPRGSSLGFTLIAIYLSIFWNIVAVYLGTQLMPLLFVLTGWAEGYLLSGKRHLGAIPNNAPIRRMARRFCFRRVLA